MNLAETIAQAEHTMKCCQRGTPSLAEAHGILADCYGTIGRLVNLIRGHNQEMKAVCKLKSGCPDCPKHYQIL